MTQTAEDQEHVSISEEGEYLCRLTEVIIERGTYPDEMESGYALVYCPACHRWIADQ
jgi:hypothetical protein